MDKARGTLFIGTSHIDPDGYARLSGMLEKHKPGMVLLEVSPMSVILRKTYGLVCRKILRRNIKSLGAEPCPELLNIAAYLDLPYEYTAVRDYCRRTGAGYRLVDVSVISLARFFHAYRLVTRGNIAASAGFSCDRFGREKAAAVNIFSKRDRLLLSMKLSQFSRDRLALYRENILLRRVLRLANKYRDRAVVYIGGWEHLIDDPEKRLLYARYGLPKRRAITFMEPGGSEE